jgi:hypothetical protein
VVVFTPQAAPVVGEIRKEELEREEGRRERE